MEKENDFELIVGSETGEIMNGDVPVRWCITPQMVKKMEEDGVEDPHILLVTATPTGKEMDRKLIPLTELMTYVRFKKAGEMKLYGFILNGNRGRKHLHSTYMKKVDNEYATEVIFYYTNEPHDDLPFAYKKTSVNVIIPDGVFGKEPHPLIKWYVNLWHSSKPVDECHFRRRMILAFTLKLVPFIVWTFMLLLGRVALTFLFTLAGYWHQINYKVIFKPYKYSSIDLHLLPDLDITDNKFKIVYSYKDKYDDIEKQMLFSPIALNPLSVFLLSCLILFLTTVSSGSFDLYKTIIVTISVIGGTFVIFAFTDICVFIYNKYIRYYNRFNKVSDLVSKTNYVFVNPKVIMSVIIFFGVVTIAATIILANNPMITFLGSITIGILLLSAFFYYYGERTFMWFENLFTVSSKSNDYTEIRELLCPNDEENLKPDIHKIPPKQRTIRLWYLDLKNKICKPMQQ